MKPRSVLTFAALTALDVLEDTLFLASRPSMARMDRYWGRAELNSAFRAFERWKELEYLERVRQGDQVFYRLAERGKELLAQRRPSPALRKRTWDGQWRMVVFDFPETARKARDAFRRLLRDHRMGGLQKSVWITPNPVISEWKRLLQETELTEWVLLFESAELGPVDDVEIACKVWSLDELNRAYTKYLSDFRGLPKQLRQARASALDGELGERIRRESRAYFDCLYDDPMLPSVLSPADFGGAQADSLHAEVRNAVRDILNG